jgi:DNA-binding NarL/FixJ family response regulator
MKRNEGDCSNCPSRWFCKELCDPAKWYANQDYVYRTELPMELVPPRPLPTCRTHPELTTKQLAVVRLIAIGLTISEIAETLEIKTESVYQHVWRIKKKHVNL